jgi:hypothetical protein
VAGIYHGIFGIATSRKQGAHGIAGLPARGSSPTFFYRTGYFHTRHQARHVAAASVFSLAHQHIRPVHTGGMNAHEYLVGSRLGHGLLAWLQYLGAAGLLNYNGIHYFLLVADCWLLARGIFPNIIYLLSRWLGLGNLTLMHGAHFVNASAGVGKQHKIGGPTLHHPASFLC